MGCVNGSRRAGLVRWYAICEGHGFESYRCRWREGEGGTGLESWCRRVCDFLKTPDTVASVREATGGKGVTAALVLAGSRKASQDALECLAPFGTLVAVGIPPPTQPMQFHPLRLIDLGIHIICSLVGTKLDLMEAIEFVGRGLVKPIVLVRDLDAIENIAHEMKEGTVSPRSLLLNM